VCPGERTDIQATVFDAGHHFVTGGTIEIYGMSVVTLTDVGQFYTSAICTHPPSSCSGTLAYRNPGFPSFSPLKLRDAVFFPAISARRNLFFTPTQLQAAYFDEKAEPAQQVVAGKQIKPEWQIFLESVGGAAIITVFGGGIIGALLTSFLQRKAKEREILLNQLDADKQRRLQREQVYLDGQLKVATEILETVTEIRSKSENLTRLTTARFSPKNNPSTELKDYRNQVRSDFNELTHTWKSRREILSALLGTYHKQDRRIFRGWIGLQKATTAFMEKSESIYNIYYDKGQVSRPEEVVEKDYVTELEAIEKAMHEFSEALYCFRSQFNSDMDRFESAQTSPA
jgi:uncharacterized membrane-anchored protein YhcB (DUF1043 family)